MVLEPLLAPARAARLVAFADRQPDGLSLPEVVDAILAHTWRAKPDAEPRHRSLRRVTERVALDSMMMLGGHADTSPEVRAYVLDQIARARRVAACAQGRESAHRSALPAGRSATSRATSETRAANAPKSVPTWGGRPRSRYPLPPGPPLG